MSELKYPHLFKPIVLGNQLFRNRIFGAPMGYLNNHDCHMPVGAEYYYARKAKSGLATTTTFDNFVLTEGASFTRQVRLDEPDMEPELARIAYGIAAHGAVPAIELSHSGMYGYNRGLNSSASRTGAETQTEYKEDVAYGPSETMLGDRHVLPMTEEHIERVIQAYADGAALAMRAGFGMIFIHAGHGWLFHQFLSPITNRRTDKWGGTPENRARFLVAALDAIHARIGRGVPIEVRISGSEGYEGGYGIETGIDIARAIDGHADLIHVSAASHEIPEVFTLMTPSMFRPEGVELQFADAIRPHVKESKIGTIGGYTSPEFMDEIIASGRADVISVARAVLAEPHFVNKIRSGREDEARRCIRCLHCFSVELTHGEVYCAINPEGGRDLEVNWAPKPVVTKKKVLVAGGGVAGMTAALTAAKRGHEVILAEKADKLGGVLRCEDDVDFKKGIAFYLDQQAMLCEREPNIEIRLNTEVTPEYAKSVDADVIIAALGATVSKPPIPGIDNDNVMDIISAYDRVDEMGDNVVIIGGGLSGLEQGIYLARSKGKNVTVVVRHDVKDGGNNMHMMAVNFEIMEHENMKVLRNTVSKEITAEGVRVVDSEGVESVIPADTVIYATGMKSRRDETIALYDCAPEFYPIGDCCLPKNMAEANMTAYTVAEDLGTF